MNNNKKIWIILSCMILIIGAFGYGYYSTLAKIGNDDSKLKPNARIEIKKIIPPQDDQEVNKVPIENKVTPSTILEKKVVSINTGKTILEYNDMVPDNLVNLSEKQVVEYFKNYGKVEFVSGKITITRELPYLPDCYVVRLENKNINLFKTDSEGNAVKCEEFEPIPYKNRDTKLEKGIEVDSEEEVWKIVQDYE